MRQNICDDCIGCIFFDDTLIFLVSSSLRVCDDRLQWCYSRWENVIFLRQWAQKDFRVVICNHKSFNSKESWCVITFLWSWSIFFICPRWQVSRIEKCILLFSIPRHSYLFGEDYDTIEHSYTCYYHKGFR